MKAGVASEEQRWKWAAERHKNLEEKVAKFNSASGLNLSEHTWDIDGLAAKVKAAAAFNVDDAARDAVKLADRLEHSVKSLRLGTCEVMCSKIDGGVIHRPDCWIMKDMAQIPQRGASGDLL